MVRLPSQPTSPIKMDVTSRVMTACSTMATSSSSTYPHNRSHPLTSFHPTSGGQLFPRKPGQLLNVVSALSLLISRPAARSGWQRQLERSPLRIRVQHLSLRSAILANGICHGTVRLRQSPTMYTWVHRGITTSFRMA